MHIYLNNKNNELCTKEYLTKRVSSLASRATIINFINDQISFGSLVANTSSIDGRIKNFVIKFSLIISIFYLISFKNSINGGEA
mgnify:CR=1 FL=1